VIAADTLPPAPPAPVEEAACCSTGATLARLFAP
jgi:hypothetical protein